MINKLNFTIIFLLVLVSASVSAIENQIVMKINNEIITSIDIQNEKKYLKALNPKISSLNEDKLNLIAKNSLIKEKIKKKEILNYVKDIKLKENFLNELIKQRYSRLNLNNRNQFLEYIKNYDINIKTIENKISVEALWNQLIYQKFSKNLKINREKLEKDLIEKISQNEKKILLSEIVFKLNKSENLNQKYLKIIENINKENFESAALVHSISDSSNVGGKIGWIMQSSLNKAIRDKIKNLKINEISKPILTPNGYLVLKIDNIKFEKRNIDKKKELDELINLKKNEQLNRYSIIYFNKIKKNTTIDEI